MHDREEVSRAREAPGEEWRARETGELVGVPARRWGAGPPAAPRARGWPPA